MVKVVDKNKYYTEWRETLSRRYKTRDNTMFEAFVEMILDRGILFDVHVEPMYHR